MDAARATAANAHQLRVTGKRLWCQRLACGRIIIVKQDGTLVLCIRRHGHAAANCFNPECRKSKTRRAA
jgi:hypothetical protein